MVLVFEKNWKCLLCVVVDLSCAVMAGGLLDLTEWEVHFLFILVSFFLSLQPDAELTDSPFIFVHCPVLISRFQLSCYCFVQIPNVVLFRSPVLLFCLDLQCYCFV